MIGFTFLVFGMYRTLCGVAGNLNRGSGNKLNINDNSNMET
jgi:hypothetical protein